MEKTLPMTEDEILNSLNIKTDSNYALEQELKDNPKKAQEELMKQVRMLVPCGGKYGFVSSHAANSFGLAMMLFLFFRRHIRWTWLLFLWALLISYSRIYVGVHFPGDVLFGALTGILIAEHTGESRLNRRLS